MDLSYNVVQKVTAVLAVVAVIASRLLKTINHCKNILECL